MVKYVTAEGAGWDWVIACSLRTLVDWKPTVDKLPHAPTWGRVGCMNKTNKQTNILITYVLYNTYVFYRDFFFKSKKKQEKLARKLHALTHREIKKKETLEETIKPQPKWEFLPSLRPSELSSFAPSSYLPLGKSPPSPSPSALSISPL